jgi:3-deoxy-manno-octulosonate cytidylyltransferase (CMP-KDO synthetase)
VDMMRIFEHGEKVCMVMTEAETLSVDTPDDLKRVLEKMKNDLLIGQYAH